tara:strand:- start:381 stop:1013 length:633 start_codon:yes stop_codon:yes gene_type:complete
MLKEYTLVFAKTIKNENIIKFNSMSIFLKKFFGFEIKSKIYKNEKRNLIENKEEIVKNNIENENIQNENIENGNIEKKLNDYGIPSNIQSGLLSYEENLDEEVLKTKLEHFLITNTLLENFNKYFEKKTDDIIMIIRTEEYDKIVENMFNTMDNNVLKLPKINNKNSIIGLNNILTFKIDENQFKANRTNVLKHLMSLLEQNKLISILNK